MISYGLTALEFDALPFELAGQVDAHTQPTRQAFSFEDICNTYADETNFTIITTQQRYMWHVSQLFIFISIFMYSISFDQRNTCVKRWNPLA